MKKGDQSQFNQVEDFLDKMLGEEIPLSYVLSYDRAIVDAILERAENKYGKDFKISICLYPKDKNESSAEASGDTPHVS